MKKCSKCKKTDNPFSKNKSKKDGLSTECKICKKETDAQYYNNNKECIIDHVSSYAKENKEKITTYQNEYRIKNKKKLAEYDKERNQNLERKAQNILNQKNRLDNDIAFKAIFNVRNRVGNFLRRQSEKYSKTLGCSKQLFFQYIESQFQSGMTWENYGEWELDHAISLSNAYKNGPEIFKKACHYTNVRPLWKSENRSKGAKNVILT